jgi:hypothetical protein
MPYCEGKETPKSIMIQLKGLKWKSKLLNIFTNCLGICISQNSKVFADTACLDTINLHEVPDLLLTSVAVLTNPFLHSNSGKTPTQM